MTTLRTIGIALALCGLTLASQASAQASGEDGDLARWKQTAAQVTITRDDWGVAHVHGHTDAEAVFGMAYAQAEDDFNRIEINYLTALGRRAEAEGPGLLMQDLRARLYVDPADLQARYERSPAWLKTLMDAWADGLNDYLATHPKVTPKVIKHFEPWMALSFSEGSIGGDIESVSLAGLADFYGLPNVAMLERDAEAERLRLPSGSNGIAIAPSDSVDHHALLLINPHTSFYFRSELQMSSDEGLDAYGAATWGQFFLYQGFNARLGWMHTSSHSDAIDEFAETIVHQDGKLFYRYGAQLRPVQSAQVTLKYRTAAGDLADRTFTIYKTQHGPIVRHAGGRWVAVAMMYNPVDALAQSFALTKAHDFAGFMKVMQLKANTSNNTIYADADGNIAFLAPQFVPRRDIRFDYTQPVDGADPATDWQGLHALDESPHLLNPSSGWIQNTNNWPFSAAGPASPRREAFPRYMDTAGENVRGLHALALLKTRSGFTPQTLMAAAYDAGQPGFDILIPHLLEAYDQAPASDPLKARLAEPIARLRAWDRRWSADSIPTTLAVYWGEALWEEAGQAPDTSTLSAYDAVLARTTPAQRLRALAAASDRLTRDFGTWRLPWGQVNRFQRLADDIAQPFDDARPSLAVPFTSGQWGSLASINGPKVAGLKKRYGDNGNSFVAVVEFGDRVRARAVTAGGESGDPASPHFTDEVARYAAGNLREVYFYPDQLIGHTERSYHPGG
jgi:acyl-homoserine-lactone acylase